VAQALLPTLFFAIFAGGLVAAILSTVDSTLLVSSGLMSHNLIVPVFRVSQERTKVVIARAGVMVFGLMAYVQAIRAEGVFELVEEASAFGSAGVLITVCFGLFSKMGGPVAATLTLSIGVVAYVGATTGAASSEPPASTAGATRWPAARSCWRRTISSSIGANSAPSGARGGPPRVGAAQRPASEIVPRFLLTVSGPAIMSATGEGLALVDREC
jgi:Na+/proline symporter